LFAQCVTTNNRLEPHTQSDLFSLIVAFIQKILLGIYNLNLYHKYKYLPKNCFLCEQTGGHARQALIVFLTASLAYGMYDREYQVIDINWRITKSKDKPALFSWKHKISLISYWLRQLQVLTHPNSRHYCHHQANDHQNCSNDPRRSKHFLNLVERTHKKAGTVIYPNLRQFLALFYLFYIITLLRKLCFRGCTK
jgi:hypothetical protein